MNILIIMNGTLPMPPTKGGAVEHLVQILIDSNEENLKNTYTVYSIYDKSVEKWNEKYVSTNYKYIYLGTFKDKVNKFIRYILNRYLPFYIGNAYISKVIKDIKKDLSLYDAIIIENAPEYILPLRKVTKNNLILHLHNDVLNKETRFSNIILNNVDKVFCLSNFVRNKVKEIENSDKVFTLYNGIDVSRFSLELDEHTMNRKKIRDELNLNEEDIVFLYTGRIVKEKGVIELLESFANLIPLYNNIKLVIVGSPRYGETVQDGYFSKCKEVVKKYEDKIILTGYIEYENIPNYYCAADVGIIPSRWEEPFALTVIEHMAAGLPTIVSDCGGMIELINKKCSIKIKNDNKFIENLSNAMAYLIVNKEERLQMSLFAKKQANQFNKENYINRFEELLDELKY